LKNGLLSAIVATFLLLSFPRLSPDSGDQTVALLTQLVNASTGAHVEVQNTPFKAPASIVRVNVLWILSLILSLCCALLTTSMQQWARVYLDYTQSGPPRKRARIREYMFEGVEKFRLRRAIGTIPFLLHISVFLFFAGLIDLLLPINTVVAYSALGCVAAFAFAYVILTFLPILHPKCPYRTPLSGITYISFQLFASSLFWAAKAIEGIFHGLLMEIWRWSHLGVQGSQKDWPSKWRAVLEDKVLTHYERFLHGLQCRVELGAMKASSSVDVNALRWTLTTFDEEKECEDFAACIPGFFDSHEPDTTSTMLSLMSDQSTPEPILGTRLRELLTTCLPGSSLLAEEQRKIRLRVCLTGLWYYLRALNLPKNLWEPLAPYVRDTFASPQMIRWIQTEKDFPAHLLGRCFGSLVVNKLASDIASPAHIGIPPTAADIACLSSILGATGEQVCGWLDHKGSIDLANVISLASGEFETLVASGIEWDVAEQTFGILAKGIVSSHNNVEWDRDQVVLFRKIYSKFANAKIPDALKGPLRDISEYLPPTSYVEEQEIEIPSPELDSETIPFPGPSQNFRVLPVHGFDISSTPTRD
jgi:hypothetical protein